MPDAPHPSPVDPAEVREVLAGSLASERYAAELQADILVALKRREWGRAIGPALASLSAPVPPEPQLSEVLPTYWDAKTIAAALHAYAQGDRLDSGGVHARMCADLHHYGDLMEGLADSLAASPSSIDTSTEPQPPPTPTPQEQGEQKP